MECILGTPSWIAMPRFPVLQADKVRPVDDGSGTGSCANSFSYITEKLQVPTADLVVSTIRTLASSYSGKLGAWIVDEKIAFRQLPVAPESRAVAVVVLCAPDTGRVAYFWTLTLSKQLQPQSKGADHAVGPGSPDDRQELFRRPLWGQPAGISPKTRHGPNVDFLVIVFDFDWGCLGVKPDCRTRLLDELHEILSTSQLSPGRAGKLKGKLLFVAGHYSGRHGRAFLGAIGAVFSGQQDGHHAEHQEGCPGMDSDSRVRCWRETTLRRVCRQGGGLRVVTNGAFPDIRTLGLP